MIDRLVVLIVDEGKWTAVSMGLALLAVAMHFFVYRRSELPVRRRILGMMVLFFGCTVGTMALGHLLAVTTKLATGRLVGSAPLFYAIGVALAVPSWWLICHTRTVLVSGTSGGLTLILNAWLAITLLALGLHNLPLALPGFLNIAYRLHSRPAVGWVIVGIAVVVSGALFTGSLIFMASGQSFEQFGGIE